MKTMSRARITARFPDRSTRLRFRTRLHRRQAGFRHACREQFHQRKPLRALHAMPACDLRQRASAAEAEVGSGVHLTNCDARRFFAHGSIVTDIVALVQARLVTVLYPRS